MPNCDPSHFSEFSCGGTQKDGSALHFFYVAPLRETFFLLTRRADWLCCWAEIF